MTAPMTPQKPDIFVSVDVETTGPCPGIGELCTIGAVAYDGDTLEEVDRGYWRLISENNGLLAWDWDESTKEWWAAQDEEVRNEALWSGERASPAIIAGRFRSWVFSLPGKPVFVAHPGAFDWAWINDLLLSHASKGNIYNSPRSPTDFNPFGHRPACLRSMTWALGPGFAWGQDRAGDQFHVSSKVPHHALHDAEAQGETLVRVLREIRRRAKMFAEPTGGTTHGVGLMVP